MDQPILVNDAGGVPGSRNASPTGVIIAFSPTTCGEILWQPLHPGALAIHARFRAAHQVGAVGTISRPLSSSSR